MSQEWIIPISADNNTDNFIEPNALLCVKKCMAISIEIVNRHLKVSVFH